MFALYGYKITEAFGCVQYFADGVNEESPKPFVRNALVALCLPRQGKERQNGKLGHSCTNVTKGKLYGSQDSDHAIVHLGLNLSSSANNCGCVVNGGNAMAAI